MKISFSDYNFEDFLIKEGMFCGIPSKLIGPDHIATKFNQKNKIFRSSIWSLDNNQLLSAGMPKFCNWGENPDNFPIPTSLNGCTIVAKVDGSLCVCDYINDQLSMHTRGTLNYSSLENASDFEYCLNKYPKIVDWLKKNPNYSLLMEIVSPSLRIVLFYPEPDFWLIGAINKDDYSLMPQSDLDKLGIELGIKRPQSYNFDSIDNMLTSVASWINREGVVLYSNKDQNQFKIKAELYCIKHRLKDNLSNFDKVLDFYISENYPSYSEFHDKITQLTDFETANEIAKDINKCVDGYSIVKNTILDITTFVNDNVKSMTTRKDQALLIIKTFDPFKKGLAFKLLDNKSIDNDDIKKLIVNLYDSPK